MKQKHLPQKSKTTSWEPVRKWYQALEGRTYIPEEWKGGQNAPPLH